MIIAHLITSAGEVTFDGVEWDLEYTIDRSIREVDTIGGPPKLIDLWANDSGATDLDMVDATFTAWMSAADGYQLEAKTPPYAGSSPFELWLPGLPDTPAFPGFANFDDTHATWNLYKCTMTDPVEAMGKKGVGYDLFGYRFAVHFSAHGGGVHQNERGEASIPAVIAVPDIVRRKFGAHQLQDWSKAGKPLPTQTDEFGGPTYPVTQHGRRRDATVMLDHLSAMEADGVIAWFRRVRKTPFTAAGVDWFGPEQGGSVQAIARSLKVNRGAGWWWDLSLDLTKL